MRRRRILALAAALGVGSATGTPAVAAAGAPAATTQQAAVERFGDLPDGPTVGLEPVGEGLTKPVQMAVAEESADRRFVADAVGQVYVHGPDGVRDEPFLDVSDRMLDVSGLGDERGLLGLAFHPDFAENGRFYARYSAPRRPGTPDGYAHSEVVAEFRTTDDGEYGDPDTERTVLEVPEPQGNHNAGPIAFGPDGYLYATFGDGGNFADEGDGHPDDWYEANAGGNGQSTDTLLGSVVRIDVDAEPTEAPGPDADAGDWRDDAGYAIPADNPLVDGPGRDELYAWGFRNPWGMSFHGEDLYVVDVGQDLAEEVNLVEKGGNYGWNVREGTLCFSTDDSNPYLEPRDDCPDETPDGNPLLDPIVDLQHDLDNTGTFGTAVVGGYVYEGEVADLDGAYVFGNFSESYGQPQGMLLAAHPPASDGDSWSVERLEIASSDDGELGKWVLGFGADADDVYVLTVDADDDGAIYRIGPPSISPGGDGTDGDDEDGSNGDDEDGSNGETGDDSDDATDPENGSESPDDGARDETDDDEPNSGDEGSDDSPGFGIGAAVAGVAGAGAWLGSRTRTSTDGSDAPRDE